MSYNPKITEQSIPQFKNEKEVHDWTKINGPVCWYCSDNKSMGMFDGMQFRWCNISGKQLYAADKCKFQVGESK